MSDIAIRVEGLSKQYHIGEQQSSYQTFRHALTQKLSTPFRAISSRRRNGDAQNGSEDNTIWALKDVSFDVKRGEVVGFIGRNGAGKSTLLKILSRITEPTSGHADVTGRVGSLLEVGTGFHPELTGRENVYLNGAILGMSRVEIKKKFDEIVEFAEVSKFIDTPVKHYSSGMYLRLAFAVAAHMEPDILLVDEVLAVGDAAFQKKCLGMMQNVSELGRTVLFVSHNMGIIQELCQRGILLEDGKVVFQGKPAECITKYLIKKEGTPVLRDSWTSLALGQIRIGGGSSGGVSSGQPIQVQIPLVGREADIPWIFFIIEDATGQTLVHSRVTGKEIGLRAIDGNYVLDLEVPPLWLSTGVYTAYFKFLPATTLGWKSGKLLSDRIMFEVQPCEQSGEMINVSGKTGTVLSPQIKWNISPANENLRSGVPLSV